MVGTVLYMATPWLANQDFGSLLGVSRGEGIFERHSGRCCQRLGERQEIGWRSCLDTGLSCCLCGPASSARFSSRSSSAALFFLRGAVELNDHFACSSDDGVFNGIFCAAHSVAKLADHMFLCWCQPSRQTSQVAKTDPAGHTLLLHTQGCVGGGGDICHLHRDVLQVTVLCAFHDLSFSFIEHSGSCRYSVANSVSAALLIPVWTLCCTVCLSWTESGSQLFMDMSRSSDSCCDTALTPRFFPSSTM